MGSFASPFLSDLGVGFVRTLVKELARSIGKGPDMRLLDRGFDCRLLIPGPSRGLVAGLELLEPQARDLLELGPLYELE